MRTKHPQSQRPAITIAPTMPARHPQCYKYDTHLDLQQSKPWQTAVFIRIAAAAAFIVFFSMEAVGMCHVSQVPKELALVSRKMGEMEKTTKSNYLFIYFKISRSKETHSNILQNFKKSCLSFNFPLFKHLKKPSLHFAARPFFVPLPSCFDVHNSFSHTAHSGDPLARVQAHKGLGLGNFSG